MSPRALLNLQNLKQAAGHLHSVWVLLPEPSREEEEEVEEEEEEAEEGCEGSGARQPNFLGADDVAELGLDLEEMPLELQAIALSVERRGGYIPCTPPVPWHPPPPRTCHLQPPRTLESRKSTRILLSISTRFTLKMSLLFLLSVVEMVTCKGRGGSNYSPKKQHGGGVPAPISAP